MDGDSGAVTQLLNASQRRIYTHIDNVRKKWMHIEMKNDTETQMGFGYCRIILQKPYNDLGRAGNEANMRKMQLRVPQKWGAECHLPKDLNEMQYIIIGRVAPKLPMGIGPISKRIYREQNGVHIIENITDVNWIDVWRSIYVINNAEVALRQYITVDMT